MVVAVKIKTMLLPVWSKAGCTIRHQQTYSRSSYFFQSEYTRFCQQTGCLDALSVIWNQLTLLWNPSDAVYVLRRDFLCMTGNLSAVYVTKCCETARNEKGHCFQVREENSDYDSLQNLLSLLYRCGKVSARGRKEAYNSTTQKRAHLKTDNDS